MSIRSSLAVAALVGVPLLACGGGAKEEAAPPPAPAVASEI